MLKLLLVEDHPLVREGMAGILRQLDDEVQVLEAGTCQEALVGLTSNEDIDLVLLDLALPGLDGFACMEIFRRDFQSVPVVIISAYDDSATINRAFELGVAGFIPKTYPSEQILAVLRSVLAGQLYRPDGGPVAGIGGSTKDAISPDFDDAVREAGLTERQAEVLAQVVQGKSNRDIAQALGISEGTVKIHITAVFKTLGVSSRTQALVAASRLGRS